MTSRDLHGNRPSRGNGGMPTRTMKPLFADDYDDVGATHCSQYRDRSSHSRCYIADSYRQHQYLHLQQKPQLPGHSTPQYAVEGDYPVAHHCTVAHDLTPPNGDGALGPSAAAAARRLTLGHDFSAAQIDCLCEAMLQAKSIDKLDAFLRHLAPDELNRNSEELCKARATVAHHRGNYDEVYRLLLLRQYSPSSYEELQHLWYSAHYCQAQRERGESRPLRAVDKYRVRRKHPLPKTIWDGEETLYCFKTRWRRALNELYAANRYPTPGEKQDLSDRTGLTMTQINNWFKNKRQRETAEPESDDAEPQWTGQSFDSSSTVKNAGQAGQMVHDSTQLSSSTHGGTPPSACDHPEDITALQTDYRHLRMALDQCHWNERN